MPAQKTRAVIQQELAGTPIEDVFEWIELEDVLGSASIAQVSHEALALKAFNPALGKERNLFADDRFCKDVQSLLAIRSKAGGVGVMEDSMRPRRPDQVPQSQNLATQDVHCVVMTGPQGQAQRQEEVKTREGEAVAAF